MSDERLHQLYRRDGVLFPLRALSNEETAVAQHQYMAMCPPRCVVADREQRLYLGAVLAGIFVFMSMIGFVAPNAAAIALGQQVGRTGAASGLMGTMLLTIGVAFGALATWAQRIAPDALFPVLLVAGGGALIVRRAATHNQ